MRGGGLAHHSSKQQKQGGCGSPVAVFSFGVLTISDKGADGKREDTSGERLKEILISAGYRLEGYRIVPDRIDQISKVLVDWVDRDGIDLIITTGGTGVSPSDLTPEATRMVIEREIPGIAEAMRQASFAKTPHALLSRGIAGIRQQSLIINLPGSERGARENLEVVMAALPHALAKIKGSQDDCGTNQQ